jgi:hypothetical protein
LISRTRHDAGSEVVNNLYGGLNEYYLDNIQIDFQVPLALTCAVIKMAFARRAERIWDSIRATCEEAGTDGRCDRSTFRLHRSHDVKPRRK